MEMLYHYEKPEVDFSALAVPEYKSALFNLKSKGFSSTKSTVIIESVLLCIILDCFFYG